MEYRCRLGTPGGDIIEGIYVADSEARLRREFEEKGLLRPRDSAGRPRARWRALSLPRRRRVPSREFLVFNQELATLLKAGMPLVQSLDILRRRVSNPHVQRRFSTTCTSGCGRAARCRKPSKRMGSCFPGVYTASLLAGEKSGNLESVLRRYVAYVKVVSGVRRKTISALVYPAILLLLSCRRRHDHRACASFRSSARSTTSSGTSCRGRRGSSSAISEFVTAYFWLIVGRDRGAGARDLVVGEAARPAAAARSSDPEDARAWFDCAEVLDVAGGAHARDAARRRHPARERDGRVRAVAGQSVHGGRAPERGATGARGTGAGDGDGGQRRVPGRRRSRWSK